MTDMTAVETESPIVYPHQLSPETLTVEEEVGYMVESARIHYERGTLGAAETRQWIAEMLPDGYRIGEDGEIASDDPAAPPLPNLGEWVPLPQSER